MNTKQEIAEMTVELFLSKGRKVENEIVTNWVSKLSEQPIETLRKAFAEMVETVEHFPSVAHILELCRKHSPKKEYDPWAWETPQEKAARLAKVVTA